MGVDEHTQVWLQKRVLSPGFPTLCSQVSLGEQTRGRGRGRERPHVLSALGSQTAQGFPLDLCELQVVVLVLGGVRQGWVQEPRKACGNGEPRPCADLCWWGGR